MSAVRKPSAPDRAELDVRRDGPTLVIKLTYIDIYEAMLAEDELIGALKTTGAAIIPLEVASWPPGGEKSGK